MIEVKERFGSREQTGTNSFDFLFYAKTDFASSEDPDDIETLMRQAIIDATDPDYDSIPRVGITAFKMEANDLAFATVTYSAGDLVFDPGETQTLEFDTTGGSEHITQSKETLKRYGLNPITRATGDTEGPDFKGAIGVGTDLDVAGVDLYARVFNFSIRKRVDRSDMTEAYLGTLYNLTATSNSAEITLTIDENAESGGSTMTFAVGELLFIGCRGSRVSQTQWELNFMFAASPNATGLTIGELTGIDKKGWEYLWVHYKPKVDSDVLACQPKAVYIEKVFDAADHNSLNLD